MMLASVNQCVPVSGPAVVVVFGTGMRGRIWYMDTLDADVCVRDKKMTNYISARRTEGMYAQMWWVAVACCHRNTP